MIDWNDEQRALRMSFEELSQTLNSGYSDRESRGEFPEHNWRVVADSGLLGLPFEREWGGLGRDLLTTMFVLEGMGYSSRDTGLNFSVTTHLVSLGVALQRYGNASQKRRYLPSVCDGRVIGAHAITEPEAGSDAMNMRSTARLDGETFILDGTKSYVTNGPLADVFVVYARTGREPGFRGISAFLVDRSTPGLAVGPPITTMGLRTSPFGEITLDSCAVPASQLLGRTGSGFLILEHVLAWEIFSVFATMLGEMDYRLARCVNHATTRQQFGAKLSSFESVSNKLVDAKIAVETSRKWLYDAAQRFARGKNATMDIAIAKLLTSEANINLALTAIQLFGARGYMVENGIEVGLRDAVAGTIYSGTSEMQRKRIATLLGL